MKVDEWLNSAKELHWQKMIPFVDHGSMSDSAIWHKPGKGSVSISFP
jgi:hypothetical protein